MKAHWFLALSMAGFILLAGHSFGGELRWKKQSDSSESEASSVLRIPLISANDEAILQVQAVEPIQQIHPPQKLPSSVLQLDRDFPDMQPSVSAGQNPPSGATLRNDSPLPPQITVGERGTTLCDGKVTLKNIKDISHDIRLPPTNVLPEECRIDGAPFYGRHFSQSCVQWTASAVSTKGAYFEDVQLERYGHSRYPRLQPIISGAKFFATVPFLPYKMGVNPPSECVYTLGHYRTGNHSPYMVEPIPISPRGVLYEAGAVTGAVLAVP